MTYRFVIRGTMPSLNELLSGERQTYGRGKKIGSKGNDLKQMWQKTAVYTIRQQLKGTKPKCPIVVHYRYFERNRRRDLGNVHGFAQKIVEDALQAAGTIPNDGWEQIRGFTAEFFIDKLNPRIEVELEEVEDD